MITAIPKFRNIIVFIFLAIAIISCKENNHRTGTSANLEGDLKRKADSLYYAKNDLAAAVLFTKLIAIDSTKGEYYFKRGYSLTVLLMADNAISDLLKAAALNYRVAEAYRNIAVNYHSVNGNDSLAVYYINKSLQVDSTDKDVKKLKEKYEQQWKTEQYDAEHNLR